MDRDRFDIEALDEDDPFEVDDQRLHLFKHEGMDLCDISEVWTDNPMFYPGRVDGPADWLMVGEVTGDTVLVPLAAGQHRIRRARSASTRSQGEILTRGTKKTQGGTMREDQQAYEFYKNPANQVPAGDGERRQGRRLSETVPVRFPKDMIEAVRRFAVTDGVTVSAWIRHLIGREIQRRQPSATSATSGAPSVQLDYSAADLKPASQTLAESDLVEFAATA